MNRKDIAVIALMAIMLAVGVRMITGADHAQRKAQTQRVEDAVQSAALTCYAVEGAYPMDLNYLKENYGLSYDEDRYRVTYSAFASNLVPEIYVIEVGADQT